MDRRDGLLKQTARIPCADCLKNMWTDGRDGPPGWTFETNGTGFLVPSAEIRQSESWERTVAAVLGGLLRSQALHRPSHTWHSHHAGSGIGCVMYTLEGVKRSSGPAGNFARNGRRTA